jgi:hypothetical protein
MPGLFPPIPPPQPAKPVTTVTTTSKLSSGASPRNSQSLFFSDDLSHDTNSTPGNKKKIKDDQWREILDATETLATRYQEQKVGNYDDNASISDDTINEVNDAINKFREHATRLGLNERELMAAVKYDDRSLHPSVQSVNTATVGGGDFVSTASNKFIDMFEYYFAPPQNGPESTLTTDS